MPDWSYHPLKKLILEKVQPKTSRVFIHQSMHTIASIPGGCTLIQFLGHMEPPQALQKELSGILFPSPIGLSHLIDPKLTGLKAFQELGLGFIEIGPVVLKEPSIQLAPKIQNDQLLFAQQAEKVPLKHAIKKLIHVHNRVPILAYIDSEVTKSECEIIVQQLTPYVGAFVATSEQILALQDTTLARPLYASFLAEEVNGEMEHLMRQVPLDGIIIYAPRQTIDGYWYEKTNAHEELVNIVNQVKSLYPELVVITSGGVQSPKEAYTLIATGVDLLMLGEGYVKAGPGLPKRSQEKILFEEAPTRESGNWSWSLLFGVLILIGGILAFLVAFTRIVLPYDEAFIGLTIADISKLNPLILSFMAHDRMALAGTMISGGILYIQLARHGMRWGMHWAKVAFHSAAIVGFLGILLFIGYGYFDWLHGLFWLILLPVYYISLREAKGMIEAPAANHENNDSAWQLGNYGQLLFVILGFSIVIGGIVISTIGVSRVFVTTDLSFLCMTPDMLNSINENLIPVIAHDRAGFGSALISVGMLVLMLSLWGFRKGERWVWNTLAIGALPAFVAGIGTHFYIGYTTFMHLLPVYFLVFLYVLGLVLSYPYLKSSTTS